MSRSFMVMAALVLASPTVDAAQPSPVTAVDQLGKDVAACLVQARAALGLTMADASGRTQNEQIDAYAAQGRIYFNNPFVSQNPTFAFWKCLRLRGYDIPSQ